MFSKKLNLIQEKLFDFIIFISYALIFASFFNFSSSAPMYLKNLDYYFRIYICLFLIWRFNPFRQIVFTELDRKIAFNAGLFILTTTALNNYIIDVKEQAKKLKQLFIPN